MADPHRMVRRSLIAACLAGSCVAGNAAGTPLPEAAAPAGSDSSAGPLDDAGDPLRLALATTLAMPAGPVTAMTTPVVRPGAQPLAVDRLESMVRQGLAAREAGDYRVARDRFNAVLAEDPQRSDVLLMLAMNDAYDKDYPAALAALDRAQALSPTDVDLVLSRARVLSWSGQLAEARILVDGVIDSDPENAEAWDLRARLYWYQSRPVETEAAARKASALDPDNTDYALLLAQSIAAQSRRTEARELARKLQPLRPDDPAVAALLEADDADDKAPPLAGDTLREGAATGLEQPGSAAIGLVQPEEGLGPLKPWRIDLGLSHSSFERVPLQDWSGESAQLNRWLSPADTVYGRVEHANRFGETETALTAGDAHQFNPGLGAYAEVGVTPASGFFPAWRVAGGVELEARGADEPVGATALIADAGFSHYVTGNVFALNPGVIQYFAGGRAWLTLQLDNTIDGSSHYLNGWAVRADVLATESWNLHAGWSKGPQAESARSGSVVDLVRTFTAGTSWQVTPDITLRLDYLREDWSNSYIRDELMLGASFRF